MPLAPDDLPRSPTGRVPQWALDEATRTAAAPVTSAAPTAPRGRRRRRQGGTGRGRRTWPAATIVVLAAVAGSWWLTHSTAPLPTEIAGILDALPGVEQSAPAPAAPPPTAEVVALADAAHLSDEGREVFYATQPEILDAAAFAGRCTDEHAGRPLARGEAVGCYDGSSDRIALYAPPDARLQGFVVETAAHEALHAAWARLTEAEQASLAPLLETELASLAPDDDIHEQIAGSVGTSPENRPTELFSYLGTQLWRDGGLAPALEEVYSRFIADRAALVAVHTSWEGLLDGMRTDIETSSIGLVAQETTNAQERAQLEADRESVAYYDTSYREKDAEVAAMSADEQARLRLSWVWWDGTDLPMAPATETLALAADLLARDAVDLSARETALVAAEAVAAAERTRIDAVRADLEALQAQLSPTLTG